MQKTTAVPYAGLLIVGTFEKQLPGLFRRSGTNAITHKCYIDQ